MSNFIIRNLAIACAPRIAAKVEAAVMQTVRDELAGTIETVLHEMYAGETLRLYVSKAGPAMRRERDHAIRAAWTGRNASALAHQFGLSTKQIFRIATGKL